MIHKCFQGKIQIEYGTARTIFVSIDQNQMRAATELYCPAKARLFGNEPKPLFESIAAAARPPSLFVTLGLWLIRPGQSRNLILETFRHRLALFLVSES